MASNAVLRLDRGDLLTDKGIVAVNPWRTQDVQEEAPVRHKPVDATALMLQLAHHLTEAVTLDADELISRHGHSVERDCTEAATARHVLDRPHFDTGRLEVHGELRKTVMFGAVTARPRHDVAPVGTGSARRPDLAAV